MDFALNEEQEALKELAAQYLAEASPPDRVRQLMDTDPGWDPADWAAIVEMGWPAIAIDEAHGGFGLGHVALAAVLEQTGRSLLCSPFFATAALAVPALQVAGTESQQATWLSRIAAGELTATLALVEPGWRWRAANVQTTARSDGSDVVLNGTKTAVVDGHTAGLIVVAARHGDGPEGLALYAIPSDTPGLQATRCGTMDRTRKQAEIRLDGVRLPAEARLCGAEGWTSIQQVIARAGIALAAEQVGVAEAVLELAVDYAKVRQQFGRPIGSFQAIKHKCAQMLLWVESARSAAWHAAWVLDCAPEEAAIAAATAQATCSQAAFRCAAESIQVHGGIGFTWEHDAHLYFKRARASEQLLGPPTLHRETVCRHIGLAPLTSGVGA